MPSPSVDLPRIAQETSPDPILFVGDVQGCLGPLEALLRTAGFDPDRHRLIPIGDTINRGPDSLGTLRLLRSLGAAPIRGNHEEGLLKATAQDPLPQWALHQTWARDLLVAPDLEEQLAWIRSWPHVRRGPGWIAVHAGLHPVLPVERTPPRFLVSVRVCDPSGERPIEWDGLDATIPPGFHPWFEHYRGEDTVIFGHWARRGLQLGPRYRGIDSGAVYGGKLTGLWWPEDRLVQVEGLAPAGAFPPSR